MIELTLVILLLLLLTYTWLQGAVNKAYTIDYEELADEFEERFKNSEEDNDGCS